MAEWLEEMTEYWHNFWGMTYLLPGFYQVLLPYAFALGEWYSAITIFDCKSDFLCVKYHKRFLLVRSPDITL